MAGATDIRGVVGSLLGVKGEALTDETTMHQFSSSLERTKLEFGLKRLGLKLPAGDIGPRYGDFVRQLGLAGGEAGPVSPIPRLTPTSVALGQIQIGIDIEPVGSLPDVADPWESEFYANTFTPSEIARNLTRAEPRVHFAANWCAKEALKKSHPGFASLGWLTMELLHDEAGAPSFRASVDGQWQALPCAVSISHAGELAVAVVAWGSPAQVTPAPIAAPTVAPNAEGGGGKRLAALALLLAGLSLMANAYLLIRR